MGHSQWIVAACLVVAVACGAETTQLGPEGEEAASGARANGTGAGTGDLFTEEPQI